MIFGDDKDPFPVFCFKRGINRFRVAHTKPDGVVIALRYPNRDRLIFKGKTYAEAEGVARRYFNRLLGVL